MIMIINEMIFLDTLNLVFVLIWAGLLDWACLLLVHYIYMGTREILVV